MTGKRILVVDDEPSMRSWLRLALEHRGARVWEATGGWEALALLAEHEPFDLVITDMRMPMPSGVGVIASARSIGIMTPFILATAFSDEELRRRAGKLEKTMVLDKPFELSQLVQWAELLMEPHVGA
jgi:CheY-like chemotaxis protein